MDLILKAKEEVSPETSSFLSTIRAASETRTRDPSDGIGMHYHQ